MHIDDTVVTGDLLSRAHQGEREFSFVPNAILTPTAWDYIRQHRLQVSRGGEVSAATSSNEGQPETAETEGRIISEGQCEHPDRSCGCKHEEFGSGYVEPSCCHDCAIHKLKREGDAEASCEGCNRHKTLVQLVARGKASDPEELIRRISEIVAHRLED